MVFGRDADRIGTYIFFCIVGVGSARSCHQFYVLIIESAACQYESGRGGGNAEVWRSKVVTRAEIGDLHSVGIVAIEIPQVG